MNFRGGLSKGGNYGKLEFAELVLGHIGDVWGDGCRGVGTGTKMESNLEDNHWRSTIICDRALRFSTMPDCCA